MIGYSSETERKQNSNTPENNIGFSGGAGSVPAAFSPDF